MEVQSYEAPTCGIKACNGAMNHISFNKKKRPEFLKNTFKVSTAVRCATATCAATVWLAGGRCRWDSARRPSLLAGCRTAAGLSPSASAALVSSSASRFPSAAGEHEREPS